jgi:hypothetical protein
MIFESQLVQTTNGGLRGYRIVHPRVSDIEVTWDDYAKAVAMLLVPPEHPNDLGREIHVTAVVMDGGPKNPQSGQLQRLCVGMRYDIGYRTTTVSIPKKLRFTMEVKGI